MAAPVLGGRATAGRRTGSGPAHRRHHVRRRRLPLPGAEHDALHDVALHRPAGRTVAIVGPNGAGKSTLVKLLTGLYEPTSGQIAVDGLEGQLGTSFGGVEPSLGQWQRLALARSLMREVTGDRAPLCVVLDEPTAALDPIAEQELFGHFVDQVRGSTGRGAVTVLVSHRFTTVRMANLIVVLDGGRVRAAVLRPVPWPGARQPRRGELPLPAY